jgi:hypothetical protein
VKPLFFFVSEDQDFPCHLILKHLVLYSPYRDCLYFFTGIVPPYALEIEIQWKEKGSENPWVIFCLTHVGPIAQY